MLFIGLEDLAHDFLAGPCRTGGGPRPVEPTSGMESGPTVSTGESHTVAFLGSSDFSEGNNVLKNLEDVPH